jgi:hypothetical protein
VTHSTERPLLYLDVDGVINAISYGDTDVELEADFRAAPEGSPRDYRIRVPAGTRDRVAELERAFDMVWATTWEHAATQVLKLSMSWTVKLDSVLYHAEQRPCAWVDDLLYDDAYTAFERRGAQVAPSLLVQPFEQAGLGDEHVAELLDFAASLR